MRHPKETQEVMPKTRVVLLVPIKNAPRKGGGYRFFAWENETTPKNVNQGAPMCVSCMRVIEMGLPYSPGPLHSYDLPKVSFGFPRKTTPEFHTQRKICPGCHSGGEDNDARVAIGKSCRWESFVLCQASKQP